MLLLLAALAPRVARAACENTEGAAANPAYLLVIDHSGSMTEKVDSGQTRWEEMRARAIAFVSKVPDHSSLWFAVFEGNAARIRPVDFTLDQPADREAALKYLQGIETPRQGNTALYAAKGMAFEHADQLARETPGRRLTILVYTDGKDEPDRGVKSPWNEQTLKKRFEGFTRSGQNIDMVETFLANQTVNPVLPIRLLPGAVSLMSPRAAPRQKVKVEFCFWSTMASALTGKEVELAFEAAAGSPVRAQVAGPVRLRAGVQEIELEVLNAAQLPPGQGYAGKLVARYPAVPGWTVMAEGGGVIQVDFQKADKPELRDVRPLSGEFAVEVPVGFSLTTLQGAKVLWDFGDGTSEVGAEAHHTYHSPQKYRAHVKVEANGLSNEADIDLNVLDLGVTIDPLTQPKLYAGRKALFTLSSRGKVERSDWIIDGVTYDGHPRADGQSGSQIEFVFQEPGEHTLRAQGHTAQKIVDSPGVMKVSVAEEGHVAIRLAEPSHRYGEPVQFGIEHPELATVATWDFGDGTSDASGNLNPSHPYARYGAFAVKAQVTGKEGQALPTDPVTVNIEPHAPRGEIHVLGAAAGGMPVIRAGSYLKLDHTQTGDVESAAWRLDGQPVPAGETSVSVPERGPHRLTLRLHPPAGGGGDFEQTLEFLARDYLWFVLGTLALLILTGFSYRLFIHRNAVRPWRVYYGIYRENTAPAKSERISDWWHLWFKRAEIPLTRLFKNEPYWGERGLGKGARLTINSNGDASCNLCEQNAVKWKTLRSTKDERNFELTGLRADEHPAARVSFSVRQKSPIQWGLLAAFLATVAVAVGLSCLLWQRTTLPAIHHAARTLSTTQNTIT